mmetsp:Transcript_15157/g.21157  ORF Transcript_15157/g.21157 Transcript_15157/m.21157 type:complete len:131 (-) Transcript_15157:84-476(-)
MLKSPVRATATNGSNVPLGMESTTPQTGKTAAENILTIVLQGTKNATLLEAAAQTAIQTIVLLPKEISVALLTTQSVVLTNSALLVGALVRGALDQTPVRIVLGAVIARAAVQATYPLAYVGDGNALGGR